MNSCTHITPKFGCANCIEKRGKIFDNDIDYQLFRLKNLYDELYNIEKKFTIFDDKLLHHIEDLGEEVLDIFKDLSIIVPRHYDFFQKELIKRLSVR